MPLLPVLLSLTAACAIPVAAVELDRLRHRYLGGQVLFRDFLGTALCFIVLMGCFGWFVWRAEWRWEFGWTGGHGVITLIASVFVLYFYHWHRSRRR